MIINIVDSALLNVYFPNGIIYSKEENIGRIITNVRVKNLLEPEAFLTLDALVDTGAVNLILSIAWKNRLGKVITVTRVNCETAT